MADEDLSAAPTELETPATGTEQQAVEEPKSPDTDIPEGQQADGDAGDGTDAEDFDEIEVDGQSYQVPKALKTAFMKNTDYTQKTQEVAARRKVLEARETEIEERLKVTEEELQERAVMLGVKAQIEQYQKVDWDQLEVSDPMAAQKHWRIFQQLQSKAAETARSLETKSNERTVVAQQDFAKRVQETLGFISDPKNGFKSDSIKTLTEFAVQEGISEEAIKKNWSPTFVGLLRKAHVGHLAMQKQISSPKAALRQPAPAPLKVVAAKSNPTNRRSLNEMSVADHAEQIRKEAAARRA